MRSVSSGLPGDKLGKTGLGTPFPKASLLSSDACGPTWATFKKVLGISNHMCSAVRSGHGSFEKA